MQNNPFVLTLDAQGILHISIEEVLRAKGWPDTPEVRAIALAGTLQAIEHEFGAKLPVKVVHDC